MQKKLIQKYDLLEQILAIAKLYGWTYYEVLNMPRNIFFKCIEYNNKWMDEQREQMEKDRHGH